MLTNVICMEKQYTVYIRVYLDIYFTSCKISHVYDYELSDGPENPVIRSKYFIINYEHCVKFNV